MIGVRVYVKTARIIMWLYPLSNPFSQICDTSYPCAKYHKKTSWGKNHDFIGVTRNFQTNI